MQQSVICMTDLRMRAEAPMHLPADMISSAWKLVLIAPNKSVVYLCEFQAFLSLNNGDRTS